MSTFMAWVLVASYSNGAGMFQAPLPPMTKESCLRVQSFLDPWVQQHSRCIEIEIFKVKEK